MKLAIVGSRDFNDYDKVIYYIRNILDLVPTDSVAIISPKWLVAVLMEQMH